MGKKRILWELENDGEEGEIGAVILKFVFVKD